MRSYREELWFETRTRRAYLNITPQVEEIVKKSGVQEGLVLVEGTPQEIKNNATVQEAYLGGVHGVLAA